MPLAPTPAHHLLLQQWWREGGEAESQREWQDERDWVQKKKDSKKKKEQKNEHAKSCRLKEHLEISLVTITKTENEPPHHSPIYHECTYAYTQLNASIVVEIYF